MLSSRLKIIRKMSELILQFTNQLLRNNLNIFIKLVNHLCYNNQTNKLYTIK